MSAGWGTDQLSTLTVELAQDPLNSDMPNFPPIGTPAYFTFFGLTFNGLFQKISEKHDVTGDPVWEVICTDPRAILVGTHLIIGAYNGPPLIPNVQNVFGYMENNRGFGGADVNDGGMPWNNILFALNAMCNGQDVSAYGAPLVWNGVQYSLDLSQLPQVPDFYRIGGTTANLLEAIGQVCADGATDFFVTLEGFTIVVNTVSRLKQPPLGTISALTTADMGTDLIRSESGIEARSDNVPNSVLLIGGDVTNLHLSANLLSFWGYNIDGDPIVGIPSVVNLQNNNGKNVKTIICESMVLNAQGVEDIIGDVNYFSNTLEMRFALSSYSIWATYIQNYRPDINPFIYSPFTNPDPNAVPINPALINDARKAALNLAKAAIESDFHTKSVRLYEFVRRTAETYYGKVFLAGIPFVAAHEDDETFIITYSLNVTDAAWYSEDLPPLSLPELKADILRVEDGRYRAFVEYDLNPNNAANLGIDFTSVSSSDSVVGNNTLYVAAQAEGGIVVYNGSPYALLNLPGAVFEKTTDITGDLSVVAGTLKADEEQFKKYAPKMAQGNVGLQAAPAARYPVACAVPLVSRTQSYGPWFASGAEGPAGVEHDTTLVPWNYGGEAAMELAAQQRIINAFSNQTLSEAGVIELAGPPAFSLGDILQANGPNITNIEVGFGPQGVFTTYRFQTFTPRFGVFSKYNSERLRRLGVDNQRLKRGLRQAINQQSERLEAVGIATRTAAANFLAHAPKAIKRQSPHETLLSYNFIDPSGNVRVGVSSATYEETVAGVAETIIPSGINDGEYLGSAAMSVAGLVRPYATVTGSGNMMPALTPPSGDFTGTSILNSSVLNPLQPNNDIEVYTWGNTYQGLHAFQRGASVDARGMALKGPLVMEGFGFDLQGKPVPGDGADGFLANYLRRSDQWPVGPLDPLWDTSRGVWSVHDLVQGSLSGNLNPGDTDYLQVYKGNTPTALHIPVTNYGSQVAPSGVQVGAGYLPHSNNWMTFPLASSSGSSTQWIKVTSTTPSTVTIGTNTIKAFPAVLTSWNDTTGAWTDSLTGIWFYSVNGQFPIVGNRYKCVSFGTATDTKVLWGEDTQGEDQWIKVTSPFSSIVTLGMGPITAYPAVLTSFNSGVWLDSSTVVWFYSANGQIPIDANRYKCVSLAVDSSGKQVWGNQKSTTTSFSGARYTLSNTTMVPSSSPTFLSMSGSFKGYDTDNYTNQFTIPISGHYRGFFEIACPSSPGTAPSYILQIEAGGSDIITNIFDGSIVQIAFEGSYTAGVPILCQVNQGSGFPLNFSVQIAVISMILIPGIVIDSVGHTATGII